MLAIRLKNLKKPSKKFKLKYLKIYYRLHSIFSRHSERPINYYLYVKKCNVMTIIALKLGGKRLLTMTKSIKSTCGLINVLACWYAWKTEVNDSEAFFLSPKNGPVLFN